MFVLLGSNSTELIIAGMHRECVEPELPMLTLKQANLELPLDMGVHRPTQHTTSSGPYPQEPSCQVRVLCAVKYLY